MASPAKPVEIEDITDRSGVRQIVDRGRGIILIVGPPLKGRKLNTALILRCNREHCDQPHHPTMFIMGLN